MTKTASLMPTAEFMLALGLTLEKHGEKFPFGAIQTEMAALRKAGDPVCSAEPDDQAAHASVAARFPALYTKSKSK